MLEIFFKTAWRNLVKNKAHSLINITGLSAGMAVAILIGLWIYDEMSFDTGFQHHDKLAKVMQHQTMNGVVGTQTSLPYVTGDELRKNYGGDFKYVSMMSWTNTHILAFGDKKISQGGNFMEPDILSMLSLPLTQGNKAALAGKYNIILSASAAKALFGSSDPMNNVIKIDNKYEVKVSGIYKDLPYNSEFKDLAFIAAWQLFIDEASWPEKYTNAWRNNSFQLLVQLADNADMQKVSDKIKDVKLKRVTPADAIFKPAIFLLPMAKWHLFSEFKSGINTGGRIQFVWLFGIIGFFVLLLACINFMNLSTARSEKRAKEVGIRKAIGSSRIQLIRQFFAESLLVVFFALILCVLLVVLILPFFNTVSDKRISIPWSNSSFWFSIVVFTLVTGIIAGSYPALYLSSFKPVQVLKGSFRAGRFASVPRKVLVVLQFSVSVILVIGTMVVFNQIQFAKNRPIGYNRDGLLTIPMVTEDIHKHYDAVSNELINSAAVASMAESSGSVTYVNEEDNGFDWQGRDASVNGDFNVVYSSIDYGKTIGWKLKEGRDFSKDFHTDSTAIILNETAAKFTGLKHPVGAVITWDGKPFHVVGIVKDMVMQSPYEPVFRTVFVTNKDPQQVIVMRVNPSASMHNALAKIESVFKRYNPEQPFECRFTDDDYAMKFGDEERIGRLASFFAVLAIFISCLGLFGMASFMAEQRTKEIGVRKVLGASVISVCKLLSKDFVLLVLISLLIAVPVAYYFMYTWLQGYQYRTQLSWWIFGAAGAGALVITLLTVSFQAIRAAVANPVRSLRTE